VEIKDYARLPYLMFPPFSPKTGRIYLKSDDLPEKTVSFKRVAYIFPLIPNNVGEDERNATKLRRAT
jgi:hypothetical protein